MRYPDTQTKMDLIPLGTSGRQTTRLGFGGSSLMGALNRRDSLRLLETAFDAGIRHFDVAPMYGYGEAESCLGDFLQRHRDQVTVTTKYGIPPAKNSGLLSLARRVAGPIVQTLPGLKQGLARVANAAARNNERATFTAAQAEQSLHRSLAALRTPRIDLWLLHEVESADLPEDPQPEDPQNDPLLHFLHAQVQQGTIGAFGIGSSGDKVSDLVTHHPAYCRTLQYEWSVLNQPIPDKPVPDKPVPDKPVPDSPTPDPFIAIPLFPDPLVPAPFLPVPLIPEAPIPPAQPFRIHHRALTDNFRALHSALTQNHQTCARWSAATATDLTDPANLARLMLKAALLLNPSSIILFSSKKPEHIHANVAAVSNSALEAPARHLYHLVQTEHLHLLTAK